MIITARYVGENHKGYEKDQQYFLEIVHADNVSIKRKDQTGKISYKSLYAFLKNWTNIVHISFD